MLDAAYAERLDGIAAALRPPPTRDELRQSVGGAWDEIGQLQFDYVVAAGLQPKHSFIDIGCGVLRGGLRFVRYLEPGHYYGIDSNPDMIRGALAELETAGLGTRDAHLRRTKEFDLDFSQPFDHGLALSVFTHIPLNSIYRALTAVAVNFAIGGDFHATYFSAPDGPERFSSIAQPAHDGHPRMITYADADPYHYSFQDFQGLCERLPLRVEDIGEWGHPRGQLMLRFTRVTS